MESALGGGRRIDRNPAGVRARGMTSRKLVALAPLLALGLLVQPSQAKSRGGLPGFILRGQVVDANSGSPLPRASVRLNGTVAKVSPAGRFTLTGTKAGRFSVVCSHPGYRTQRRRVRVRVGKTTVVHCRLRRARAKTNLEEEAAAEPKVRASSARDRSRGYGRRVRRARRAAPGKPMAMQRPVIVAPDRRPLSRENYNVIDENDFHAARSQPLSTFSIDVDTASYSNVRRFLNQGRLPPKDAVKLEEFINYFSYSDPAPRDGRPFAVTTEVSRSPWADQNKLVRIGIRGKDVSTDKMPPSNLVFLLDVSGSMNSPSKLPLLKNAFRLLVSNLRARDRVAIVVYAGAAGVVLPSTRGNNKAAIVAAIDRLSAGGSTAGGAGIELAYDIARRNFIQGGNNRVILATDGDFNVGTSSEGALVRLIEKKRKSGVFLTVLGFGTGNYQDSKMEKLADKGNGNHAYIDSILEAKKVLVSEMGGTLLTIAKDVKIQVEFNPARVEEYRLIGYENRKLAARDFNDDKKDAGELGAGHSITALYEIVPKGTGPKSAQVDALRYQRPGSTPATQSDELMTIKLRYKKPAGKKSTLMTQTVLDRPVKLSQASADLRFAAAVAEFGMLLRDSKHKGRSSFSEVLRLARRSAGPDRGGYRAEFVDLVRKAMRLGRGQASIAR